MTKRDTKDFSSLPKIIAVDFDGTLCTDCFPSIGIANLNLITDLIAQREKGVKLILWTSRTNNFDPGDGDKIDMLDEAVKWCSNLGLEFDAVNDNIQEVKDLTGDNTRKIYADLYIDDKGCDVLFANRFGHMNLIDLVKSWNNLKRLVK